MTKLKKALAGLFGKKYTMLGYDCASNGPDLACVVKAHIVRGKIYIKNIKYSYYDEKG